MVDAMSIDPSDLGIEEFETLETIQAELERLDEERNHEGKVIIAASRNRVVMANEGHTTSINIVKLESNGSIGINEGGDIMVEKMEEDEEEEHSGEDTSMMMMMDDQGGSGEDQLEDGVGRRFTVFATHEEYNGQESPESSGHFIFSETVVGEEIIEDEQVIKEEVFSGNEPRIYDDVESMSQEEVVSEIGIEMKESNSKCEELEESIIKDEYEDQLGITSVDMEEVTSDNVLSEETVIGEVQEEEEEDIDEPPLPTTMVLGPAHQPMVVTKQQPQVATTLVLKTESMVPNSGVGAPGMVTMSTPQLHSQPQQITVVGSSSKLGPNPPPGVYVVATTSTSNNLIGAQSILQAGTILSQKDSGKVTRMIVSSGGGGGEVTQAPQTIRIIGSQGKLLGSPAKTITLAQAKQMGLITSANQHILPAAHANKTGTVGKVLVSGTKKTVTVMKSPTKILPAPSPSLQHQQQQVVSGAQPIGKTQKVLIRQANTLKAGTILAGGGQSFIRIPTSQTLNAAGNIHQIHIPGKQVQYVKLVGAGGGGTAVVAANPTGQKVTGTVTSSAASSTATTTFVPVSAITKSIPVALPTSVLNSSQTHSPVSQQPSFKVVPIQQQQSSAQQGNIITTPTHRVLIPASAVKAASSVSGATSGGMVGGITSVNQSAGGQQSGGVVSTGASPTVTTVSNIVMLPSHLIHQVKKVPLLGVLQDNKMTVTSASGLLGTTVNSGDSVVGSTSQRRPPGSPLSVATSGPTPVLAKVVTTTSAAPSIKQKDSPVGVLSSGTSPSSVVSSPPSPSLSVPSSSASPPSTFNMAGSEIGASKVAQQPQVAAAILSNGSNNGVSSLLKAAPPSDSYHSHHNSSAKTENCWSGDESSIISTLEANGIRPRKPCNCTKSMCLKLYCDCFANGEFCHQCNCTCCYNNLEHEEERQRAIKSCLERNPTAFRPKIGKSFVGSDERRHNKGCNCRRSGCLKNYCECYEAKIPCSKNCKCVGCKNVEGYLGRRSGQGGGGVSHEQVDEKVGVGCGGLGGVGGTGGGAVLGLGAGGGSGLGGISQRNKTSNNNYYPTQHLGRSPQESLAGQSNRQAFNLLSSEVVQATCQCMLAQAEDWEKNNRAVGGNEQDVAQTLIIEEFGRCIIQIIDCVTKSSQSSTNHHSSSVSGPGSSSHHHHHHHHSSSHHHHHNHHHNRHNNHHTTTMS